MVQEQVTDGLESASDVDGVATAVLHLLTARPDAVRAGLAVAEGGGRRLLLCLSDTLLPDADGTPGAPAWCEIDAYDDVPLTRAVRTGRTVAGALDTLALPEAFVERQRGFGVSAIVAAPLDAERRCGALALFLARPPAPEDRAAVEVLAARAATALQRLRGAAVGDPVEADDGTDDTDDTDGGGHGRAARLRLPGEPVAPGAARRFVRARLGEWGVDDDVVDDALLCVSELVTNAVVHTGTTVDVDVAVEDVVGGARVVLGVRDHGSRPVDPRALVAAVRGGDAGGPADLVVSGRGLGLLDALSSEWGAEAGSPDGPGLRVWCVFAADDPGADHVGGSGR
ncbi:ATP-binding protein [Nocardioides perillae]|uniref:Anti-sigma regulatory factor (Ser/Thr protein kinase) n=1 Tax=Nocardioides perillae TaxID=1119534 RepID=A0A7Y9RU46_9ACTN|nr:anti-sigma regulatory factor (Ser/Thr protein kinase) [Nocardioides perillae]